MAVDHRRVEAEIERIDNLLHEARLALKSKAHNETYLRGVREAAALVSEADERLYDLDCELGE